MFQPSAPAREPKAWIHVPSQPLMRSPLSRSQTPAPPRRVSRFFRVWLPIRSPCRAVHSAYFGLARFISPILSAVDGRQTKQLRHLCQRKIWRENKIPVNGIVEKKDDFRNGSREFWQSSADQNSVGLTAKGTSCAHSWSSFSGRFTRVLTGYFFISSGSNGLRQALRSEGLLMLGSSQRA